MKKEGGSPWSPSRIWYLRDFVENNDLLDLGFSGPKFTWARKEDGVTILQERLDRFLVNEAWIDLWPDSTVYHAQRISSNHNPIFLDTL